MKLIIEVAIDEINPIIKDEIKNLEDIETKIMIEERWVAIWKLWKNLEGFKINKLEIKLNAEIKILKDEQNKIRNVIDLLKKIKVRLLSLCGEKDRNITFRKKVISIKRLKQII